MPGPDVSSDRATPPTARRIPHVLTAHGDERHDDWYWLRDRDDPEVIAYLEAENAYADAMLAPLVPLRERHLQRDQGPGPGDGRVGADRRGRVGVHVANRRRFAVRHPLPAAARSGSRTRPRWSSTRTSSPRGTTTSRSAASRSRPITSRSPTPSTSTGASATRCASAISRAETDLPDVVENVTYGLAWADDARTCFYVRPDDAMRPYEVWRHVLGTPASADTLVMREDDERFYLGVERTRSGRFVLIDISSKLTSEVWFVPTECSAERAPGHRTARARARVHGRAPLEPDRTATGSSSSPTRAVRRATSSSSPRRASTPDRDELDPARPAPRRRQDRRRERVRRSCRAERTRQRARTAPRAARGVRRRSTRSRCPIPSTACGSAATPSSTRARCGTATRPWSHRSPTSTTTWTIAAPRSSRPSPSWAATTRRDTCRPDCGRRRRTGPEVPMSLVHRRDTPIDGSAPALLYGYGSYEISSDPSFRSSRLSLLDRGFVFAIAHVRGGGEMGREWYEDGRLEHKMNTFTDFVACAEHLIASNYTSPARLTRPGRERGRSAHGRGREPATRPVRRRSSPRCRSSTSSRRCSTRRLPLTVTEWEEWGDPREPEAYARMKEYSPYDNVRTTDYPALLVTTGLNDPRVQYWEPAKWVSKLRQLSTSTQPIYLRTEMGAGHGGPSGRYDAWRDEAIVLAFVCSTVGRSPHEAAHGRRPRARSRVGCARGRAPDRGAVPSAPAVRRKHAQHRHLRVVRGPAGARHRVPALQLPGRRGQRRFVLRGTRRAPRRDRRHRRRNRRGERRGDRRSARADRLVVRRRHRPRYRRPARRRLGRHRAAAAIPSATRVRRRRPTTRVRSCSSSPRTTSSGRPDEIAAETQRVDSDAHRGRCAARATSSWVAPSA